jgi:ribonuclease PH
VERPFSSHRILNETAALCAETQDRQSEILEVLNSVLDVSKFPSKSILIDLINVWDRA